jgi:hypothetical protein
MRHTREDVIERTIQEFELLDQLVSSLKDEDWELPLSRSETRDPWTVKDGLAHIIFWKANTARTIRRKPRPADERGLGWNEMNHLIYTRWRDRTPQEILVWHRQVQADVLAALNEAPEEYFSGKERSPQWPSDLLGHSEYHRLKDIGKVLAEK